MKDQGLQFVFPQPFDLFDMSGATPAIGARRPLQDKAVVLAEVSFL
jgi:hypothetical protein